MTRILTITVAALLYLAGLPAAQSGGSWLKNNLHDAGRVGLGTRLTRDFTFANPTGRNVSVTGLHHTCKCAGAWLVWQGRDYTGKELSRSPLTLPPGARGAIKIKLDMTGIRGTKEAVATLFLKGSRAFRLEATLKATGVVYFHTDPPGWSIPLGRMKWNEKRDFTFTLTALPEVKEWRVTSWTPLPRGVTLTSPTRVKDGKGRVGWRFQGSMGPLLTTGSADGTLLLQTDFKGIKVAVNIYAQVEPPLTFSPLRHLSFGLVKSRRGAHKAILIRCLDPEHRLELTDLRVVKMSRPREFIRLTPKVTEPGRKVEVRVDLLKGAPKGAITGTLELSFNHPRQPKERFTFSAFVD